MPSAVYLTVLAGKRSGNSEEIASAGQIGWLARYPLCPLQGKRLGNSAGNRGTGIQEQLRLLSAYILSRNNAVLAFGLFGAAAKELAKRVAG